MRKFHNPSIALVWLVCLNVSVAFSNPMFQFGVIEMGEPIGYLNEQNQASGIYADITQALINRSSIKGNVQVLPYLRLARLLDKGKIDCAIFFTSPDRKKEFQQIGLVVKRPNIIVGNIAHKAKEDTITNLLKGKTLGRVRSLKTSDPLLTQADLTIAEFQNYEQGLTMLKLNRIDAFVGGKIMIDEYYDHGDEFFVHRIEESWLQCSRTSERLLNNPFILEQLRSTLNALHAEDEITSIHRNYLESYRNFDHQ